MAYSRRSTRVSTFIGHFGLWVFTHRNAENTQVSSRKMSERVIHYNPIISQAALVRCGLRLNPVIVFTYFL